LILSPTIGANSDCGRENFLPLSIFQRSNVVLVAERCHKRWAGGEKHPFFGGRDGKLVTMDGPFAETKEQLGGFYLVEANDQDEAATIAAKIPGARFGSIEVRPIMKFS